VKDRGQASDLENRWFGSWDGDKLALNVVEIAYLLLREQAEIVTDGETLTDLKDFLSRYDKCLEEFFWPKLIVYKDLRDRGRRVRLVGDNKFLVKDKYGVLRLVVVLEEGVYTNISNILKHIEEAHDNNLKLVYAIVSLQGDLTYYEITKIDPRRE